MANEANIDKTRISFFIAISSVIELVYPEILADICEIAAFEYFIRTAVWYDDIRVCSTENQGYQRTA
jgi:hypothetical protein